MKSKPSYEALESELDEVKHQLFEAHEIIEAIRTGQVDALVVEQEDQHQLYTLKSADLAYRVFIEKMTEGAITLGKDGTILYCNSQFARLVERPISGIIGSSLSGFITEKCQEDYRKLLTQSFQGEGKGEVEFLVSGQVIPVLISMAKLEIEETVILSVIITDLSQQKMTERQLALNNYQLAVSNTDLQQFASVASHDLQEPLRKIQIFSTFLKEEELSHLTGKAKNYLDKIIFSAARMKALIVDILQYSRLSYAQHIDDQFELRELIEELMEDFELAIQEKNVKVEMNLRQLPLIQANQGQMRQALQNIISNSIKFSRPEGQPRIMISGERVNRMDEGIPDPEGPYCRITISDNGIGFDQLYAENIFALFERLHTKNTYEGTGMGMAITKKIIEKHNGNIKAMSENGQGATFRINIPIRQNI